MEKEIKVIHVTSLGTYNNCPYSWYNSKDKPIDPKMTYKGDMLNTVVNGSWSYDPFLKWYSEFIDHDFKQIEMYKKIFEKAKQRRKDLYEQFEEVYQESKMLLKYDEFTWIVGTPDVVFYDKELDLWKIRDWKLSTFSWYGNEEVTQYEMQGPIYSLMVMNMFGVDRCEFKYWVYDKGNGNFGQFGKVYTRTETEALVNDVMKRYIESAERETYEPRANKKCGFCDFKKNWTCPLYKRETKSVEQIDDDAF